ncbi:TolC family outer membrane protein [Roseateles toxinivorans]|uniref:Outer membrane protein n=1 Tax=Roseateles toxinivorans TaxID=270368 RepID=A0A4R6QJR2_9BURK|nr:TolC family outer membrane protein [Roseateles toxinivorans]TDP62528.1 outer membrane protein [Roseateles toxinivorans]
MRLSRACLLAAALCAPLLASAEDLLEVYAQARASDPVLAIAASLRGEQSERVTQARAALLPQWSLGAAELRGPQDGREHQLSSSLSQVLLDLGRLRQWDAAQSLLSAEEARLRAAEQALCARVAGAYFGVLSAQASLATAQANEDAFAQQVGQSQSRFESGISAAVDVEQARTYHALSQGATLQAREALADAREALAQITGRAPGVLKPLAAELQALPPEPPAAEAWVQQALLANPQLQASRHGLTASEQRIEAARAAHLPTLSLGLDSQRRGGSAVAPQDAGRANTTLGLRLSIPLFAGGATESLKRQAVHQRDAAREGLESARRALVRETQGQYQAVMSGVALMRSTRAAVDAATRALASTRTGQALGTRTMTDLLLAIQSQTAAQNAHEQARHRYVLAKLLLQQAAGALGEAELSAVNLLLKDS